MRVVVGSTNPVKMSVARIGLRQLYSNDLHVVEGIEVPSGVPNQPKGADETLEGAWNRAKNAKAKIEADYWIGIEGGVQLQGSVMVEVAYIAILSNTGLLTYSSTSPFWIPTAIAKMIDEGEEFGPASDKFFGTTNSKQTTGTIGILSGGVLDRVALYLPAFLTAFLPHMHPELYEI